MSGGAVAAVVVMLVAMLGLAGCGPAADLRDAWLPPTPVVPGVSVAGAEPAAPAGGWWVAAFNGEQNVSDAGMLVEVRGRADLTVADVLREGEFFANADELRALRARLVHSDDLVWRDAPARMRGPAGQFRPLAEATVDESTPSVADRLTGGATVEPTGRLQLVQPWEAGGKGTLLIRVVGGEDVFLAVPSTNRFIRWDRLLGTAVMCRGWDEVRRRFPAGPAGERSIWPVVAQRDLTAPPDGTGLEVPRVLEALRPEEVPAEWARE